MTLTYQGSPVICPDPELTKVIPCCQSCGAPLIWTGAPGREIATCIDRRCGFQAIRKPEPEEGQDLQGWELLIVRLFMIGMAPVVIPLLLVAAVAGVSMWLILFPFVYTWSD